MKRAVTLRIAALRAGKEFIPAGEFGCSAFRVDRNRRIELDPDGKRIRGGVHFCGFFSKQDGHSARIVGSSEAFRDALERRRVLYAGVSKSMREQDFPLPQLERDGNPRVVLLSQLTAINGELISPRFDGEQVAPDTFERQVGCPSVVA